MDNSKPIAIRYADLIEAHSALQSKLSAIETEKASIASERDTLKASVDYLSAEIGTLKQTAIDVEAAKSTEVGELTAKIEEANAKIVTLEGKLALSPAHMHVSAGANPVPENNGQNEGSDIVSQFAAIKDPAARTAFYKQNATALWKASNK